jgi:AcrR family transcriptional regulator
MSTPKRGRPWKRDESGDAARDRLLKVAYALFTKRPFDSVTAGEIAAAAGVAHGLLFHHFGSKHGLYLEIMRHTAGELERVHLEAPPPGLSPKEKLALFLGRHMDFIQQRPTAYVLYSRGSVSADVRDLWEESKRRALRIVLRYFGIAEPTPHGLALARAWLALFDELVLAWLQQPDIPKEGVVRIAAGALQNLMNRLHQLDPQASTHLC